MLYPKMSNQYKIKYPCFFFKNKFLMQLICLKNKLLSTQGTPNSPTINLT
jgi:hypothetical protein